MGCMASTPEQPVDPTPATKERIAALQQLWVPESIWTGTVKFRSKEEPWEIHVKRDSTTNNIKAKRVTNFAQSQFTDATKCEFDFAWEEEKDEKGRHAGWKEIITFDWVDEQYRLFADTLDGVLNIEERRIKGLVVNNQTRDTGSVDFCRVMAKKKYGDSEVIHTVSYDFGDNDKRTQRIKAAMKTVDTHYKKEHDQMTGRHKYAAQAIALGNEGPKDRTGQHPVEEERFKQENVLKAGQRGAGQL